MFLTVFVHVALLYHLISFLHPAITIIYSGVSSWTGPYRDRGRNPNITFHLKWLHGRDVILNPKQCGLTLCSALSCPLHALTPFRAGILLAVKAITTQTEPKGLWAISIYCRQPCQPMCLSIWVEGKKYSKQQQHVDWEYWRSEYSS